MATQFCAYELRTTDVSAGLAFYADVLGATFWDSHVTAGVLPERAAAQGAPPHWLGTIGVSEVSSVVESVLANGGQALGPAQNRGPAGLFALLRDPFGAVVAVANTTTLAPPQAVAWHVLHTKDHERAFALYSSWFGWSATDVLDLRPDMGCHQCFAWGDAKTSVGSIANTALLPHVHPHWLYYFAIPDVATVTQVVRQRGGNAVGPLPLPNGALISTCHDPQGAAFGLYQHPPAA